MEISLSFASSKFKIEPLSCDVQIFHVCKSCHSRWKPTQLVSNHSAAVQKWNNFNLGFLTFISAWLRGTSWMGTLGQLGLVTNTLIAWVKVGGDHRDKNWLFESILVNSIVNPIYKNREKRFFEFGDRFEFWPSKCENLHYRVKNQSCRKRVVWPIKTCVRRALSLWNRF